MKRRDQPEDPWDRREGEPSVWYGRFVHYFLTTGSRRSVSAAYRLYRRERNPGEDQAKVNRCRVPGLWHETAKEWAWKARADAHDAALAHQERAMHAELVKRRQRTHLAATQRILDEVLRRAKEEVDWGSIVRPDQYIRLLIKIINQERLLLSKPLGEEQLLSSRVSCSREVMAGHAVEDPSRFDDPKFVAEVAAILDQKNDKPSKKS